jgi:hypothetical protein
MDKNTQARYFDYIVTYADMIGEFADELKQKCSKKSSGDISIKRKKYMYFKTQDGVTLINKESSLECTFIFHDEESGLYFEKSHLHSYIESDLNVSGLGKFFPPNKTIRSELYDECLAEFISSGTVEEKGK